MNLRSDQIKPPFYFSSLWKGMVECSHMALCAEEGYGQKQCTAHAQQCLKQTVPNPTQSQGERLGFSRQQHKTSLGTCLSCSAHKVPRLETASRAEHINMVTLITMTSVLYCRGHSDMNNRSTAGESWGN